MEKRPELLISPSGRLQIKEIFDYIHNKFGYSYAGKFENLMLRIL